MCEVLILMLNSFYRVYYQLFDLCEHTLISVLILLVVLICFIPALFTMKTEEQRPLFTIGVLVCGVVGGLTVVISVVYLYRFCLKKRNPVTTTGNPDFKREHIRSVVVGLSRPLPLPPEFLTCSTPKHTSTTTLADETDPTDIGRSLIPLIVSNDSNYALRLSQNTYNTLLSVSPAPTRAHSAELLPPEFGDEIRRSSFEVQRGTGRQLPSTQGLELPIYHHQQQIEHERQRRMSQFARSNAIHYAVPPRKQVSSPLPDQSRRIYERGHAHSRSWNPGAQPSPPPPIIINPNPYRFDEFRPQTRVIEVQIPIINEPPSPTPMENSGRRRSFVPRQVKSFDDRNPAVAAERRHHFDHRSSTLAEQTRDFREKNQVSSACQSLWAAKGHLEQLHALGISEPSSVSTSFESNTDSQITGDTVDNPTVQNAKGKRKQYKSHRKLPVAPDEYDVLQQVYAWESRRAQFREFKPQVVETSSFINDDEILYSSLQNIRKSRAPQKCNSADNRKNSEQQWARVRKKHNLSLLLQRQFLSTAAVSSMESNQSTDDSDLLFASSFDSTRSELERRRLSLMNQGDQNDSDEAGTSAATRFNTRDYSVDARSDSLFREWSKVDPAYDSDTSQTRLQRGHTVDHTAIQQPRHFQRQYSLATSPMVMNNLATISPNQIQNHRRQTMVSYRDG